MNIRIFSGVAIAAAMTLSACGQQTAKTPAPAAEAPVVEAPVKAPEVVAETSTLATFLSGDAAASFDLADAPAAMRKAKDVVLTRARTGVTIDPILDEPTSGNRTGAAFVELSEDMEKMFSGKKVRLSILARAPSLVGDAKTPVAMAYSTNEVGNSGWIDREVGADWTVINMNYKVDPLVKGQGDFIGVWPKTAAVEVAAVKVSIIE